MGIDSQTILRLKEQIAELGERYPALHEDQLFTVWFLRAYLTDDDQAAINAISGGSGDKGIDAVLIDERARTVLLVQTKYRITSPGRPEGRSEVVSFARFAPSLASMSHDDFKILLKSANGAARELLSIARRRLQGGGFGLRLIFVSLGTFSQTVERDARQAARMNRRDTVLELIGGARIPLLLRDYMDGAAPPIASVDLELERGQGVRVNGILQRYDVGNAIESWVFSMKGSAIATLIERWENRIFARNIRGFMGENVPVNREMWSTLKDEPDHFFYYNNGITIICDKAERLSQRGTDILRLGNPQIINGQQTSRVLAQHPELSVRASVLVKVIQVPHGSDGQNHNFERLISTIVQGTNRQIAIRAADLVSNDRRQIDLERAFRRLGYGYLRKRQTKNEALKSIGSKSRFLIKKEDLAQEVAGCDLDPVVARSGKDNLFTRELYGVVFPSNDPDYYLARHWLSQAVSAGSKTFPQRGYLKWLVLGFLWDHLAERMRGPRAMRAFRVLSERRADSLRRPLSRAVECAYREALRYYNHNKGRGESVVDISLFFRSKRGRHREFRLFWQRKENSSARSFQLALGHVERAIRTFDA